MKRENLQNIRKTLVKPRPKIKRTFIFIGFFILIVGIGTVFISASKTTVPCYISPQQKSVLKKRISSIAATQKVSEYTLFRHMKATLKYETIGKMPCDKYTKALEYLENIERQVLN